MKTVKHINSWELTQTIAEYAPSIVPNNLYDELSQIPSNSPMKLAFVELCKKIKELIDEQLHPTCDKTIMMTISTAHISENTARWLLDEINESRSNLAVYDKKNAGFFIYIPDDILTDLEQEEIIPSDLYQCVQFALDNYSTLLCLDSDGPIVSGKLETFTW